MRVKLPSRNRRGRLPVIVVTCLAACLLVVWLQQGVEDASFGLLSQQEKEAVIEQRQQRQTAVIHQDDEKSEPKGQAEKPPGTVDCGGGYNANSCQQCTDARHGHDGCQGDCIYIQNTCKPMKPTSVVCGNHRAPDCSQCTDKSKGASWCNGDCTWQDNQCTLGTSQYHAAIPLLEEEYAFQKVRTERGTLLNVLMVRAPLKANERQLFERFKDEILFLGISSFENYPLNSPNPGSHNFSEADYKNLFPGFLTMMRKPQEFFLPETKTILMSQSDFNLDESLRFNQENVPKQYDFVYSGNDHNVYTDCVGWGSFAKNWSFAYTAIDHMCRRNMTGVLVATRKGNQACRLPPSCTTAAGSNMIQTTYLPRQTDFFNYVRASRFVFLPQIYDASPRVSTQAMAMNVPLLMNRHIVGGWKYLNDKTGEFFTDMRDFDEALSRILTRGEYYEPRKFVQEHYGNDISGKRLRDFLQENFRDRVQLPEGTELVLI